MTKQTGFIEDIVFIFSKIPWWIGAACAIVAYLWLHNIAISDIAVEKDPGSLVPTNIVEMLFHGMARYLQFLIPALCIIGSLFSLISRAKLKRKRVEDD